MEGHSKNDNLVEVIDQPEDSPSPSGLLGSPSYSPSEREGSAKEREEVRSEDEDEDEDEEDEGENDVEDEEEDDDDDEEDKDSEDSETKAARRKAKGKGKASPPAIESSSPSSDEPPHAAKPNPPLSPITEHPDADIDMDNYWALESLQALQAAAHSGDLEYDHEEQFGDADAAMNERLYSLSSSSSPSPSRNKNDDNDDDDEGDNNNNTTPAAPKTSPLRHAPGELDSSKLITRLQDLTMTPQQECGGRGRGRGRGRGSGEGWGIAWQESVMRETVEEEGVWERYDDPPPSPVYGQVKREERGDKGWEIYDEKVWNQAAEAARRKEEEESKRTLQMARSQFPPSSSRTANEAGSSGHSANRSKDLVRAVRPYKAILPGGYLSYEKGDVMEVVSRNSDGKDFTLLPLRGQGVRAGRAHTRDFVPVDSAASSDDEGREGKGG